MSGPLRSAEIVAVGSELVSPHRADTNSLYLTGRLNELGIAVRAKIIVGDRREDLADMIRQALDRVDLIIVTGGLGPTDDDITRDAVAAVLKLELEEDSATLAAVRARFESRGLEMPGINRRQALVPRGAETLANINGTAPGLWIEAASRVVVLLPGPPRELEPMFETHVRPKLERRSSGKPLLRRVLRITGRPESYIDERVQPVYSVWQSEDPPIETTILAAPGQIELHLSTTAASRADADARLDRAVETLVDLLGRDVYSVDGRSLEAVVGEMLRTNSMRIAVAESCTGGLIASRLTDVAGSSDYVDRGVVTYSDSAKSALLGVPEDLIRRHGAVSPEVALAMAEGVRTRSGVDVGVGVTGIAGPGGGSPAKPVGTVAIAVALPGRSEVRTFRFPGERAQVKFQASQAALDLVRRLIADD